MSVIDIIILIIIGFLAGVFGGLIGTGGCSIMLPVLDLYLNYPTPTAIGTTLFAVMFTTSSGAIGHLKIKNIDKETAKYLSLGGLIGVVLGSIIFELIKSSIYLLQLILGIIFLWPAIRMIREGIYARRTQKSDSQIQLGGQIPGTPLQKIFLGFIIGITTGLVGLGGGYALVPALIYLFGGSVHVVMGTSLVTMIPLSVVGVAFKIYSGCVDIIAGLLLGIGTSVGAQVGSRLIKKFHAHDLKIIFGAYFVYISLKYINLFLNAIFGLPKIIP